MSDYDATSFYVKYNYFQEKYLKSYHYIGSGLDIAAILTFYIFHIVIFRKHKKITEDFNKNI